MFTLILGGPHRGVGDCGDCMMSNSEGEKLIFLLPGEDGEIAETTKIHQLLTEIFPTEKVWKSNVNHQLFVLDFNQQVPPGEYGRQKYVSVDVFSYLFPHYFRSTCGIHSASPGLDQAMLGAGPRIWHYAQNCWRPCGSRSGDSVFAFPGD